MLNVQLQMPDGVLIAIATLPPFTVEPDILVWGSRFFRRHPDPTDADGLVYREASIFHITNSAIVGA